MRIIRLISSVIFRTIQRWIRSDGLGLAAAISFYSIFAMVPLFVLALTISNFVFDKLNPDGMINRAFTDLFSGSNIEPFLITLRESAEGKSGAGLSLASIAMLLWAASGFFSRLQRSVQKIFGQEEPSIGALALLGVRLLFGKAKMMVFTLFFGLIMAFGAALTSLLLSFHNKFSISLSLVLELLIVFVVSLTCVFVLIASTKQKLHFKALFFSGALFFSSILVGRVGVTLYLAQSSISTAYGLASSVVVALIWIYFGSIIFGLSAALCAELSLSENDRKDSSP